MLETGRLFLRPLFESDSDAVYAMRSDKDVMRFIREPQDRDETKSWIRLVSSRWETEKIGFCGVFEKESGEFLGWCGVWRLKETNELEIGYAIAGRFWNRGYATEAARAFLRYAFENIKPDLVTAVAEPENLASRRVMEKLGMKYALTGNFYNRRLVQYSITREEFLRKTQNDKNHFENALN
jgi:RimJ/RimL family protein N-acetyltransferase